MTRSARLQADLWLASIASVILLEGILAAGDLYTVTAVGPAP